jgi:hypothetical protein
MITGYTEEEYYELTENPTFMKANTIYISGKITGAPNQNKHKFSAAEEHLKKFANVVLNPHTLPANHDKSWCSYMKVCIISLCRADQVVVLDDWKNSRGAIREVLIAKWLNIPVVDIETLSEVKIGLVLKIKLLLNII